MAPTEKDVEEAIGWAPAGAEGDFYSYRGVLLQCDGVYWYRVFPYIQLWLFPGNATNA